MTINPDDLKVTAIRALDARFDDVIVESIACGPSQRQLIAVHDCGSLVVAVPASELGEDLPTAKRALWSRIQCELVDREAEMSDLDMFDMVTTPNGTVYLIYVDSAGVPVMRGIVSNEIGTRYTLDFFD